MRNRKLVRAIAITLAVLLVGGVVFSALISALAEEQTGVGKPERNRHEIEMEYLEDGQALHITQRLLYINTSGNRLGEVVFYAAGNMFRRMSALMYEQDDLETVFFDGYVPAGIDLRQVRCDEKPTDYGFRGESELYLRVACALDPGDSCTFEFDYYLLLMRCGAFQGIGECGVRLSCFCFVPGVYDAAYGEFALKTPLAHTRWLYCDAADFAVELALPEGWRCAGTGFTARTDGGSGRALWHLEASNVRDFALAFGKRFRTFEGDSASGVRVRVLTSVRGAGRRALKCAIDAIDRCEAWFGAFPLREFEIVQTDYPLGALNFPGTAWLSGGLMKAESAAEMEMRLRFCVAQQYFGLAAYVEPSADAWLTDSVSAYVACLLLEQQAGEKRFLEAVNRDWVSALQQTVPGGLNITSDAALFDARAYGTVVLERGAVVLHELRLAMGRQAFIDGLAVFYRKGSQGNTLGEMDLVAALDEASGGSWEAFLTDWLFNVGDYVNQNMDWYE